MIPRFNSRFLSSLKFKLKKSGIKDKPKDFINKVIKLSLMYSFGMSFLYFSISSKFHAPISLLPLIFVFFFILFFFYLIKIPDYKIIKEKKKINKEIVYAARFLIIELSAGVSLYNALKNCAKHFSYVGKYFRNITDKVALGHSIEEAINETIKICPSDKLNRVLWQILNSLNTGANISDSLKSITEQITKEQLIEVQEYGKKLNPIAMFYMILAIIIPSLGITMMIILSLFLGLKITRTILLFIALILGFFQFIFISIIRSIRPSIEV